MGATDAAKAGMGGVYWDHTGRPYLWRVPFPSDVQSRLVSTDNPTGSITNSDLEHAGLIAQLDVQCTSHSTTYATICNLSDNTPAVSRVKKGAISSDGPEPSSVASLVPINVTTATVMLPLTSQDQPT